MSTNLRIAIRFLTARKRSMLMSLAGIVFGVNNLQLAVPRWPYLGAQALVGALVSAGITPAIIVTLGTLEPITPPANLPSLPDEHTMILPPAAGYFAQRSSICFICLT